MLEFVYKIHTYIRVHIRMRLSIDFSESFGFGKKGSFPSLRPSGVFPVGRCQRLLSQLGSMWGDKLGHFVSV